MNWKPIETAPKDRRILLWFSAHEAAVFGQWDDEKYVRTPKPHFVAPELARLFGKVWMRVTQPTHWAEAPEPPAQPRRPYGTDTLSEYGVIPECDGSEPPAQQPTENLPPYSAWMHVLDEAMVARHLGVADPDDGYITAKR